MAMEVNYTLQQIQKQTTNQTIVCITWQHIILQIPKYPAIYNIHEVLMYNRLISKQVGLDDRTFVMVLGFDLILQFARVMFACF